MKTQRAYHTKDQNKGGGGERGRFLLKKLGEAIPGAILTITT